MAKSEGRDSHPGAAAIRGALSELDVARQWFAWVTDPSAVDEAILRLGAAERRLTRAIEPLRSRPVSDRIPGPE
jgi:hypothetical protein